MTVTHNTLAKNVRLEIVFLQNVESIPPLSFNYSDSCFHKFPFLILFLFPFWKPVGSFSQEICRITALCLCLSPFSSVVLRTWCVLSVRKAMYVSGDFLGLVFTFPFSVSFSWNSFYTFFLCMHFLIIFPMGSWNAVFTYHTVSIS